MDTHLDIIHNKHSRFDARGHVNEPVLSKGSCSYSCPLPAGRVMCGERTHSMFSARWFRCSVRISALPRSLRCCGGTRGSRVQAGSERVFSARASRALNGGLLRLG